MATSRLGALLLAAALALHAGAVSARVQRWFAPLDPFVRPEVGYGGSTDYMALFQPRQAASVLSRIAVFKVYIQFVRWASDDDLRTVFAQLKRHHVALAMEAGILDDSKRCGRGVEGYGGDETIKLAKRIFRLGGNLAYIAMDEPAFFGHIFSGTHACHDGFADLAHAAAVNLAAVKSVFPRVRAGDTEPVGPSPAGGMIADYARWADAFRAATGAPLAFSQADVQWLKSWRGPLETFAGMLRARHIPLGVIINGDGDDTSDKVWIAHALAHYRAVAKDRRIAPDQMVFQSWAAYPTRLLPDTDPGTFTYLLKECFGRRHDRR